VIFHIFVPCIQEGFSLLCQFKIRSDHHINQLLKCNLRCHPSFFLALHESPRRGETFIAREITRAATRINLGLQDKLYLGNLEAKRDWGFAGDYVEAMWLIPQQDEPDDYVIATDETHSARKFAEKVFQKLGLDYKEYVAIDQRYFRPTEVDVLLGDSKHGLNRCSANRI